MAIAKNNQMQTSQAISAQAKEELKSQEGNTGLVTDVSTTQQSSVPKKKSWELERQRDRKLVKGRFLYHEVPGGEMAFNYYRYKGDPVETYKLKDGQEYTIPLGVAKHLNQCGVPVHQHMVDEAGKPSIRIGSFQRRCTFQPTEFMVEDDFSAPPKLYTVEIENGLVK